MRQNQNFFSFEHEYPLSHRFFEAKKSIVVSPPDFSVLESNLFPPQPTNLDSFFLFKLFHIKHTQLRKSAQVSVEKAYTVINKLVDSIQGAPKTIYQIQNSSFIFDIALLLDEIELYTLTSKRVQDLTTICEQGYKSIQNLLTELHPGETPLKSVDWSKPAHTHIQELMFAVERVTQEFLQNLGHPELASFQELLSFESSNTFTQSIIVNKYKDLYTQYHHVRKSLLILLEILNKVQKKQLIDSQSFTVVRDDTDVFFSNYLYPIINSLITPVSINSQINGQVYSKILNPELK